MNNINNTIDEAQTNKGGNNPSNMNQGTERNKSQDD